MIYYIIAIPNCSKIVYPVDYPLEKVSGRVCHKDKYLAETENNFKN